MKYRSEIDGLRSLAVIPVILFHTGLKSFSGGFVGVDVFFVISGYLITTILLSDLKSGRFSIVHFYERRARRILPALFLVMFSCLPFAWFWLLPQDIKSFSQSLVAVSVFASNILFWLTSGYFDTATELKPLIHTWSLSVEEQYYLLFPLLLFFAYRFGKRWTVSIFGLVAIFSLGLSQWGAFTEPAFAFFMLPTRAWEMVLGAFVAFYYSEQNIKKHKYWVSEMGSLLGFALICYSIFFFSKQTPFPGLYALVPTIGAALIIVLATKKTLIGKLLSTKPFMWMGLISYSAYLWHQPLFAFARLRSFEEISQTHLTVLAIITIPLSWLTWRFVERPFRNNHKVSRNNIFLLSFIGSIFFFGIGLFGQFSNGFLFHYDSTIQKIFLTKDNGLINICNEEKTSNTSETCTIGDLNTSPTIAIIGDSHSTRLTYELSFVLKKNNVAAKVYAQPWCPPMLDIGTSNPHKNPSCRDYRRNTISEIISNPDISNIIMIAEWSNYTQGFRGNDQSVTFYTDSSSLEESLKENSAAVERSLIKTVKILNENGKSVLIIKSVPEYEYSVPFLLQKNYQNSGVLGLPYTYLVDKYRYNQRNKEIEIIFQNRLIKNRVKFLDTYNIYCPDHICKTFTYDGESYYIDGNHLTRAGSKPLVDALESNLF